MARLFLECVFIFLAAYGFYELCICFALKVTGACNRGETFIVVKVCNHAESIENVIRNLILNLLKNSSVCNIMKILIVDCGSTDGTVEIVKRLCQDYHFISYTTLDKYNKAKSAINEKSV